MCSRKLQLLGRDKRQLKVDLKEGQDWITRAGGEEVPSKKSEQMKGWIEHPED